jgi:hypothetical protein
MASELAATETKQRVSGEQLKQQIIEIRKSIEKINTITLALVRPDYNVTVGDQVITRAELKRTMQANDRALAQIGTQVGRGVRRRQVGGEPSTAPKSSGGITKPNVYSQELVSFLCSANLGKVDPSNPKSEDLAAVLKRSAFGKHGVATNHTIGRLISILVTLGGYKDKANGQNIVFPAGYLEKHIPQSLATLAKAGKSTTQWTYITFGSTLSAVCMTKKDQLDDKQKELLATHADSAVALNQLCAEVLNRHRDDKAPAPVVPAIFGSAPAGRQRSPSKAKN